MTPVVCLAFMVFILWTLTNIGYYYDGNTSAVKMEMSRCVLSLVMYQVLGLEDWSQATISSQAFNTWFLTSLLMASAISFMCNQNAKTK